MVRYLTLACLLAFAGLVQGQDDLLPRGTYFPTYFSELLDVEMYNSSTAYVMGVGGFIFLDVSNPNFPTFLGRYNPGSIYIRFYNGKAAGNLAIGAARLDGLYLIDATYFSAPQLYSIYATENFAYESVDFQGNYAYAAAHQNGLEIIDIQEPLTPQRVALFSNLENAWDVFLDGNYLYVADGPGGLKIYQLNWPNLPQLVGQVATTSASREVIVVEGRAYVALGAAGFDIVDVSDPTAPQVIGNFQSGFGIVNHLEYSNGRVFTANWELVEVVDVTDPLNPVLLATEDTPVRAMGIGLWENRVYVADWSGFRVYDFSLQSDADIHVKPSQFDFGFKGIYMPVSKEFTVFNLGEKTLTVNQILTGDPALTVSAANFSVPPGGNFSLNVTYNPPTQTPLFGNLTLSSNDPDESPKTINVFGGIPRLTVGDTAVNFTLLDLKGQAHTLTDYLGKTVLLAFFASW